MAQRTPLWRQDLTRQCRCPVCGSEGEQPVLLAIDAIVEPYRLLSFATCPSCGTIHLLDFVQPQYAHSLRLGAELKFYVEQGAGLDTLVLPACIAGLRPGRKYLEVGCGFGFGLDFARHAYGMDVRGIDPSAIAGEGSRLLGLDIENRYLTARSKEDTLRRRNRGAPIRE